MFKLRLNNYRGFLNEEFDFSRINILIGENSAGKSSIFKFLLALKQSLRSPNNKESNLTLSSSDEEADLGSYYETIYNHETDRNLSFAFEFKKDYYDFFFKNNFPNSKKEEQKENENFDLKAKVSKFLIDAQNENSILNFELCSDLSNHKNIIFKASNSNIGAIKFIFSNSENIAEQDIYIIGNNPRCEIIFESKHYETTFNIKDVEYEKHAFLTIIQGDSLENNIEKYCNIEKSESDKLYWQIAYLLMAQNYLQIQLSKVEYVNPLLHKVAERVYLQNDRKKTNQIKNIKDLIDFLDTSTTKDLLESKLQGLLKDFGIADSFFLKKEGFTKEFRVNINGIENNIKDVGFGVSLQLPIFAQAIFSENTKIMKNNGNEIFAGETLLIEQPEVHLHPRLQAKFIETLLSIGNNNVYFIETHSEHIIRMLQVLVKNQKFDIKPDDISIHYFKKDEKKMMKSHHKINQKTGKLNPNFPKGFYDTSYDLAFQLMD